MERADDEMDVSDEEEAPKKKQKTELNSNQHDDYSKEENNLRMQMEAYKN